MYSILLASVLAVSAPKAACVNGVCALPASGNGSCSASAVVQGPVRKLLARKPVRTFAAKVVAKVRARFGCRGCG